MLEGLTDIYSGEALVAGLDVKTARYKVEQRIGVQLEANEYFDQLSLRESLRLFTALDGRAEAP